jgi:ABC-2 type transport system ATP-binding protein
MTFRGPLPVLLDWLAKQPLTTWWWSRRSLTPIYKRFHG